MTRSDQDANQMRMNTMHVAAEKVKSKHFHGEWKMTEFPKFVICQRLLEAVFHKVARHEVKNAKPTAHEHHSWKRVTSTSAY